MEIISICQKRSTIAARRPLRADAQRNRDAIVAAARAVFDAGNFDLRFDDFAPLAGVGTGTLYRHFPTREALAAEVYRKEVAMLVALARGLGEQLPADEALAAFLRAMVDHMIEHEGLARALASMSGVNAAAFSEAGKDIERAVARLVYAAADKGAIRKDADPGVILLMLHGIGASYLRPDWKTEAPALVEMVLDGLRAGATALTRS